MSDITIENRKQQLREEIQLAKSKLQDNMEEVEISNYIFNQFDLYQPATKLVTSLKKDSWGLVSGLLSKNESIFIKIFRAIMKFRNLLD